ncbi:hypothetical protein ONZ45_g8512 [Pleurotus djamor]|nr:hypothetical protein ONZ45_g8512 [Pleurotus djamor]
MFTMNYILRFRDMTKMAVSTFPTLSDLVACALGYANKSLTNDGLRILDVILRTIIRFCTSSEEIQSEFLSQHLVVFLVTCLMFLETADPVPGLSIQLMIQNTLKILNTLFTSNEGNHRAALRHAIDNGVVRALGHVAMSYHLSMLHEDLISFAGNILEVISRSLLFDRNCKVVYRDLGIVCRALGVQWTHETVDRKWGRLKDRAGFLRWERVQYRKSLSALKRGSSIPGLYLAPGGHFIADMVARNLFKSREYVTLLFQKYVTLALRKRIPKLCLYVDCTTNPLTLSGTLDSPHNGPNDVIRASSKDIHKCVKFFVVIPTYPKESIYELPTKVDYLPQPEYFSAEAYLKAYWVDGYREEEVSRLDEMIKRSQHPNNQLHKRLTTLTPSRREVTIDAFLEANIKTFVTHLGSINDVPMVFDLFLEQLKKPPPSIAVISACTSKDDRTMIHCRRVYRTMVSLADCACDAPYVQSTAPTLKQIWSHLWIWIRDVFLCETPLPDLLVEEVFKADLLYVRNLALEFCRRYIYIDGQYKPPRYGIADHVLASPGFVPCMTRWWRNSVVHSAKPAKDWKAPLSVLYTMNFILRDEARKKIVVTTFGSISDLVACALGYTCISMNNEGIDVLDGTLRTIIRLCYSTKKIENEFVAQNAIAIQVACVVFLTKAPSVPEVDIQKMIINSLDFIHGVLYSKRQRNTVRQILDAGILRALECIPSSKHVVKFDTELVQICTDIVNAISLWLVVSPHNARIANDDLGTSVNTDVNWNHDTLDKKWAFLAAQATFLRRSRLEYRRKCTYSNAYIALLFQKYVLEHSEDDVPQFCIFVQCTTYPITISGFTGTGERNPAMPIRSRKLNECIRVFTRVPEHTDGTGKFYELTLPPTERLDEPEYYSQAEFVMKRGHAGIKGELGRIESVIKQTQYIQDCIVLCDWNFADQAPDPDS